MSEEAKRSLARGIDWLLAQQAADGGWHSRTYGQLKDGAAITTLVLDALGHAGPVHQQKNQAAIKKAFAFLGGGLAKRGTIASPDGSLDFPTYAAALYLTAGRRLGMSIDGDSRRRLLAYLLGAQVIEARGFEADSPSYGGWDFLGKGDAQAITTGTNISVTRYVLEALVQEPGVAGEASGIPKAMELGRAYVSRCQREGGGFVFTCEPMSLNNKAAFSDKELTDPRPYGTATCDGILALTACGAQADDDRLQQAIAWLVKRPALELVPGFEGLPPEAGWQRGLRYYYYAGLAQVLPLFPASEIAPRREALQTHIVGMQAKEGSWINESDRMRENDPLIATALAVTVLAATAQSSRL
ncbi:MAG: terpene cyclase/mutase family protein [Planctomycetaceae bacterium]|nr:terpene cyclase/mutase family protein [Planctomycetaceae bacterium]